jgi:hypothetical protein
MKRVCRKIIGTVALTLAITPAWGDDTETIDAVEFVLSTCLPTMNDIASIERMAEENNWFQLPTMELASKATSPHLGWRANGYTVRTWSFKPGSFPSCFISFRPFKKVDRDGFFEAISAALKLKPISNMLPPNARQEMYEIVGERPLRLLIGTIDGTVATTSIWWSPP